MADGNYNDQAVMIYDAASGTIQPSPTAVVNEALGSVVTYDSVSGVMGTPKSFQAFRYVPSPNTIGSALLGGPYVINFPTAFPDDNYTVMLIPEIGEVSSYGAVTSIINAASMQKSSTPGQGIIVSVANADSIPHTIPAIHVWAWHD